MFSVLSFQNVDKKCKTDSETLTPDTNIKLFMLNTNNFFTFTS